MVNYLHLKIEIKKNYAKCNNSQIISKLTFCRKQAESNLLYELQTLDRLLNTDCNLEVSMLNMSPGCSPGPWGPY